MHDHVRQRLRNQRLIGSGFNNAAAVVNWLGAVQAQDYHGAKWAIGQRMVSATDGELDRSFDRGDVLRTHVLRPTWHFVTPQDIRWLLELTSPRVQALNGYMYRHLELDANTLVRTSSLITGMLTGGSHLTRQEIGTHLASHGIEATGQRLAYIMMHAELEALVCSGPRRGNQHTYALLNQRAPNARSLPRDEALTALARRFFTSHGPRTIHDLAWWSGLTVTEARTAVDMAGSALESVTIDGTLYWVGEVPEHRVVDGPVVHLLPNYDEYFSQHPNRQRSSGPDAEPLQAAAGAGRMDAHHIVIDGALRGGWRRQLTSKEVRVQIDPFDDFSTREHAALAGAGRRYGAFLQRSVTLE